MSQFKFLLHAARRGHAVVSDLFPARSEIQIDPKDEMLSSNNKNPFCFSFHNLWLAKSASSELRRRVG
jgi:hypothetical protein